MTSLRVSVPKAFPWIASLFLAELPGIACEAVLFLQAQTEIPRIHFLTLGYCNWGYQSRPYPFHLLAMIALAFIFTHPLQYHAK